MNEITKQIELTVSINNLINVVGTRIKAINDGIRGIRNKKTYTHDDYLRNKELIELLKKARAKAFTIQNKLRNLIKNGVFCDEDFFKLKKEFMEIT